MTSTTRTRLRAVTPLFVVADLQRALDFYEKKLGFVEPSVHGDPPCFAMLNRDGFDLMLSAAERPEHVHVNGTHGAWDMYVAVADVAAEIAALRDAGVRIDKGPTDTFYGMREIEVLDPDGHRICIGQDIGDEVLRTAEVFEGVLDEGSAKLRLVLRLAPSNGGIVGRLDSPDQNATNLALDDVKRESGELAFEMRSIGASFQGQFAPNGREIIGRWTQGGRAFSLTFVRA